MDNQTQDKEKEHSISSHVPLVLVGSLVIGAYVILGGILLFIVNKKGGF